jgi:hypothetical protein
VGEFSIVGSISAGAWTTSVIQNLTASARRPAATSAVIRPVGSSASFLVPGIVNGASYATTAAIGTPCAAARSASAAPDECPKTNTPAPAPEPDTASMTAARSATSRSGE